MQLKYSRNTVATQQTYIPLRELEVYRLSRELSKIGWQIYNEIDWRVKKIIGDQFITSTDSIGANIAEGYKRFHYLDKIKFFDLYHEYEKYLPI